MLHLRQAFLQRLFKQNEFAMKLGLGAMRQALRICGEPHLSHRRIVVGGTNGKGSVASTIHSVLRQASHKTGLFTSPHLVDFSERIRIDGRRISDPALLSIGPEVLARFGGGAQEEQWRGLLEHPVLAEDVQLTYFELATLMAVLAFADAEVKTGVYEVGLGGRLDATNALDPTLAVVTAIGLDHQAWLGETLEEIADEKSGIMRAERPAVIGTRVAAQRVAQNADATGAAPVYTLGRDFDWERTVEGAVIRLLDQEIPIAGHRPDWGWDNVATALMAAHCHLDGQLSAQTAQVGVSRARWPGRLQRLSNAERPDVTIILDAAHNPAGAAALRSAWPELAHHRPTVVLFGAMGDKDVSGVGAELAALPGVDRFVVVPVDNPRAADAAELCRRTGWPNPLVADDCESGIRRALEVAPAGAMLLVTGSIYLLGEAISALGATDMLESTIAPSTTVINE